MHEFTAPACMYTPKYAVFLDMAENSAYKDWPESHGGRLPLRGEEGRMTSETWARLGLIKVTRAFPPWDWRSGNSVQLLRVKVHPFPPEREPAGTAREHRRTSERFSYRTIVRFFLISYQSPRISPPLLSGRTAAASWNRRKTVPNEGDSERQ